MNLDKFEIYKESYLTLLINSLIPIFILIITLFNFSFFGILIYIFSQILVLYITGLFRINSTDIQIWYLLRKSKIIDFDKISHIKFHRAVKSGLTLLIVSKDNKILKVIDENYRPTLLKIINHFNEKGMEVRKNEYWINSIQLKNGKYIINDT
jgi:hypothetical protein